MLHEAPLRSDGPQDFVAFAETSAPYGANLFVVRPSERVHAAARAAADARAFSVGRGWNGSGLLTWPSLRGAAPCAMPFSTGVPGGGQCARWPYWRARCEHHRVTNWNYVSASADNGILWWLYNLSGLGTSRVLYRPHAPSGDAEPTASGGWWAHAQSMCKPWLANPKVLAASERCRAINAHFYCELWPGMEGALAADCPAFAAARARVAAASVNCPASSGAQSPTGGKPQVL